MTKTKSETISKYSYGELWYWYLGGMSGAEKRTYCMHHNGHWTYMYKYILLNKLKLVVANEIKNSLFVNCELWTTHCWQNGSATSMMKNWTKYYIDNSRCSYFAHLFLLLHPLFFLRLVVNKYFSANFWFTIPKIWFSSFLFGFHFH